MTLMLPKNFLSSFKRAGFQVTNERELVERLDEAADWQAALLTLLRNGARIGLSFTHSTKADASVQDLAGQFGLKPVVTNQLSLV